MATISSISLSTPRTVPKSAELQKLAASTSPQLNYPWRRSYQLRARRHMVVASAAPEKIEDKVAESIKGAEEACSGDPVSGECVAAWDEVEELSATASHLRDKKKDSDPLETYCKDNPETAECRTYED
ncbi:calvin cycle protein CP12-1, chloroplastic-like [Rhodamnia argentea]|uniref:Calvin cycle protein CP12-1, chloroplastic-like n=1 Tax=Rhodamnia argentea TaxID=178133 RepID=A0A8B8PEU9_9MYRT|nr:calvin cycle protein CP12-1, chloroplastic-like [Rhodamnia argentea]